MSSLHNTWGLSPQAETIEEERTHCPTRVQTPIDHAHTHQDEAPLSTAGDTEEERRNLADGKDESTKKRFNRSNLNWNP